MADLHCPNRQRAAELLRKLRRITVEAGAAVPISTPVTSQPAIAGLIGRS